MDAFLALLAVALVIYVVGSGMKAKSTSSATGTGSRVVLSSEEVEAGKNMARIRETLFKDFAKNGAKVEGRLFLSMKNDKNFAGMSSTSRLNGMNNGLGWEYELATDSVKRVVYLLKYSINMAIKVNLANLSACEIVTMNKNNTQKTNQGIPINQLISQDTSVNYLALTVYQFVNGGNVESQELVIINGKVDTNTSKFKRAHQFCVDAKQLIDSMAAYQG